MDRAQHAMNLLQEILYYVIEDSKRTGIINVSNMGLTSLPTLPSTLTKLNCSGNQLTSLPVLPSTLTQLDCSFNEITSLPELPSTLTKLDCSGNQLTTLPRLPSTLTTLDCSYNPYIPEFADFIAELDGETIPRVRSCQALLKRQAGSTLYLKHTLGKGYNCILNDDCLNLIGSYLSGKSGTLTMQITRLKSIL